ncbi:hypothetical protein Tco_0428616 [Tanacetum coccineum]
MKNDKLGFQYGTVNAKNRRNKNKKDAKSNDVCNVVLDSQNDKSAKKMVESQTWVNREDDEVEKELNDVEKVNKKVDRIYMVNKSNAARKSRNDYSQKDNYEGKKLSYDKIVNNSSLNNKFNLIPTEVNDDGIEVNLPLEAWSFKGISVVASRLGTPLIMDQTTTNMCNLGNSRPGFARFLVNVEAGKGIPGQIDIVYKNKEGMVTGNKSVNGSYNWAPPLCSYCKNFGHNDKNCGCRPELWMNSWNRKE